MFLKSNSHLLITALLSVVSFSSHADYLVTYPLDKDSIVFENPPVEESWIATTPTYTDWVYSGDYFGCSSATPTVETQEAGSQFTQNLSGCSRERTHYRQDREQSNISQNYRNVGEPVAETEVATDLSYTQQLTGINQSFTFNYGAQSVNINGVGPTVGAYARTNYGVDIGAKIYNSNGVRVLIYFSKDTVGSSCLLKVGFTTADGWNPGATILPTAASDLAQYNYVDFYSSDNTVYRRYSVDSSAMVILDGGALVSNTVNCADIDRFYNTPSVYSKAVLSKY